MKLLKHSKSNSATQSFNCQLIKPFIFLIIGASAMGMLAPATQACECGSLPAVQQAAGQAKKVFRGKVLSMETITLFPDGYQFQHIIFVVKRFWKDDSRRPSGTKQSIMINDFRCSYPFTKGKEYLVYSTSNDQGVMKCSRTKPWDSVGREELEQLDKG
jgi:hypothetical protein